MHKVLDWLKAYWVWIVFPVGVLLLFLRFRKQPVMIGEDHGSGAVDAAHQMAQTARDHQAALDRLEHRHLEKLSQMTDEQRQEWQRLRQGSVDAAAAWIDKL